MNVSWRAWEEVGVGGGGDGSSGKQGLGQDFSHGSSHSSSLSMSTGCMYISSLVVVIRGVKNSL